MTFIATMRVRLAVALTFVAVFLTGAKISYSQVPVSDYAIETFSIKEYESAPKQLMGEADDELANYNLPFNFTYGTNEYSEGEELSISSNGWMMFGKEGADPGFTENVLGNESFQNTLALFSHNMAVSGIYINVDGKEGKRIFTVEFRDLRFVESKSSVNAQIRLYEGTNVIEYIYSENGVEIYGKEIFGIGLNGNAGKKGLNYLSYEGSWSMTPKENVRFNPDSKPAPKDSEPIMTINSKLIDFGKVKVYNTATACFTVTNTGNPAEEGGSENPLVISSFSFNTGEGEFSIAGTDFPKEGLRVGESAEICVSFAPMGTGTRSSTLMISSNDIEQNVRSLGLTGNGLVPLVSVSATDLFKNKISDIDDSLIQSFTITNVGSYALFIRDLVLSGEYRDQYEILDMPTDSLQPGESVEVRVLYIARYEGRLPSELIVMTDAFINPNRTVRLWAQGIIPRMTVTPRMIDFDSVSIGETATQTIVIANPGSDTLRIHRNNFVSSDPDFFFTGLTGKDTLIAPGTSRTVVVGFSPRTRGTRLARALVKGNMPPVGGEFLIDTSEVYIDVRGVGVPSGELYVDGLGVLDSITVGDKVCRTITLENIGLAELTVTDVSITGSTEFTVTGATLPLVLLPAGTQEITLCATPSAKGIRTGNIVVTALSGDKVITQTLPLGVFGTETCVSTDVTTAFDEIVRLGKSSTQDIKITNCGNITTLFSTSITAGNANYAFVTPASDVTLAPGESHTFTVKFTPTAGGAQHGSITFAGEGSTSSVVALNGVGGVTNLSTAKITVPATAVGSNNSFDVVVTNSGNVDWTSGATDIAPSTEYTLESSPATIAANGGTGTFRFSFAPTMDGSHNANVTFPAGDQTSSFSFALAGSTASVKNSAAKGYVLGQNYPNPFNPSTSLNFTTPTTGSVKISVVDMAGNEVAVVAEGVFSAGTHPVKFDASQLSSGVYFYQLVADGVRLERTMILNK